MPTQINTNNMLHQSQTTVPSHTSSHSQVFHVGLTLRAPLPGGYIIIYIIYTIIIYYVHYPYIIIMWCKITDCNKTPLVDVTLKVSKVGSQSNMSPMFSQIDASLCKKTISIRSLSERVQIHPEIASYLKKYFVKRTQQVPTITYLRS